MWTQAFLLLLTSGAVGAAFMIALIAALKKRYRITRIAGIGGLVISGIYGTALIGAGLATPERTLGLKEEKYICELDCHLAYAVEAVERQERTLKVTLRVRFDAETTSTRRAPDAALYPGWRFVRLIDSEGNSHRTISLGDLYRSLLPGETYQTQLQFDVDPAATGLVLYISDADPTKWALLGSDNFPLRRPLGFELPG